MKVKSLIGLLLALCLLAGCGGRVPAPKAPASAPESAAPVPEETPAPVTARGWAEPNQVDDSYAFTFEYGVSCTCDGIFAHFRDEVLPEYVARWVEDGEILKSWIVGSYGYYGDKEGELWGWVCFTGTPKQETGWVTTEYEGQTAYCRSVYASGGEDETGADQWTVEKSFAMDPVETDQRSFYREEPGGNMFFWSEEPILEGVVLAELYVSQLGQSFTLTAPEALRTLEKSLSRLPDRPVTVAYVGALGPFAPLYLTMADGSRRLALTAADGSSTCVVWDADHQGCQSAQSLFEQFGVPLESTGYTHNADGSTRVELHRTFSEGEGRDGERWDASVFDAAGTLIRNERRLKTWNRDENGYEAFFYTPEGLLDHVDRYTGETLSEVTAYTYNELGQKTREELRMTDGGGCYYEYRYDELHRLVAVIYHYLDGREGVPSGNEYYWYDEEGLRHAYWVDENQNLQGGPEGGAADEPLRREP